MSERTTITVLSGTLLVLLGVLVALLAYQHQQRMFIIATDAIELEPHEHIIGFDSMTDTGHHHESVSETMIAPRDMWVRSIEVEIENAPAVTLHHASLFRVDRPDNECPNHMGESIVTFAQDQIHTPRAEFPEGYAVFIPKGAPLQLAAMFHNPGPPIGPGDTYRDVRIVMKLHLAEKSDEQLTPLTFHLLRLSDQPCSEDPVAARVFVVPPHTESYRFAGTDAPNDTAHVTFFNRSRIVYWGAHVHGWEGGKDLTVRKNGEVMETFTATLSPGEQYRYDIPHMPADLVLEPGDTISIEATYDNPTDAAVRGAMGQFGMYVAEEE